MYDLLLRRVLLHVEAETAHDWTIRLLARLARQPALVALIRRLVGRPGDGLAVHALGRTFPSPIGLAAGFDKDAAVFPALAAFGFGFVEVGTITAEGQPGNPTPRMVRLPADDALINRMGFNNEGSARAAARLRSHPRAGQIVGVNIGKTKTATDAIEDYRTSTRRLGALADYLVVNVSSPNTPGLRDLQAVESLRPLLEAVLDEAGPDRPPVLVKIAPDLADADVDAVADLAVDLDLDGIIATNTTIARTGLRSAPSAIAAAGAGGLSGPPVRDRAIEILERLAERVGDRLVLISVGGIADAADVWNRLAAGASLVQTYTGLVYGGPLFVRRLNRALAGRLAASGFDTLQDVIGSARN
ncbi:quinone-dependent dihydroorotate dehydrogenase [Euzebya tangerina]|uniref:quinone-dependent dihydroorotate dehydrogenase n=1 Tax=Euzebya tangerina TaxID=591198 RepID=UPI000E30D257|nr:quinone-dependent dihydroorotate dehydrogenase [Euzebya tangerina]